MKIRTSLETADPETYDLEIETDDETVYLRLVADAKRWEARMTPEEAASVAAVLQIAAEGASPADLEDE